MKKILMIPTICLVTLLGFNSCSSDSGTEGSGTEQHNHQQNSQSNQTTHSNEDSRPRNEQIQSEIDELITTNLNNAEHDVNRIIAGFNFGMSTRKVKSHTQKLIKKKQFKRVKKSSSRYTYLYQLPLSKAGKTSTDLTFKYEQGGLYKAICIPKKPRKMSQSKFLDDVKELLVQWYGEANVQALNYNGCHRFIWVNGNRHIDLHSTGKKIQFVYTDLKEEKPKTLNFDQEVLQSENNPPISNQSM